MEKINFYQPKNQFPKAEIRFILKKLLPSNYKIFNRTLNKTILFLLHRKFVSTSQNEEFVKKRFPWQKQFLLPGISEKWKKTVSHQPVKQFLLGTKKFFCKYWLSHNLNNGYHQQKEYCNTKKYYFIQTEKDFIAFVSASGNYH